MSEDHPRQAKPVKAQPMKPEPLRAKPVQARLVATVVPPKPPVKLPRFPHIVSELKELYDALQPLIPGMTTDPNFQALAPLAQACQAMWQEWSTEVEQSNSVVTESHKVSEDPSATRELAQKLLQHFQPGITKLPESLHLLEETLHASWETEQEIKRLRLRQEELQRVEGSLARIQAKTEQVVVFSKLKYYEGQLTNQLEQVQTRLTAENLIRVSQEYLDSWTLLHPQQSMTSKQNLSRDEREFVAYWLVLIKIILQDAVWQEHPAWTEHYSRLAAAWRDYHEQIILRNTQSLPNWIKYSYDNIEEQHSWQILLWSKQPLNLSIKHLVRNESQRSYLLVEYWNTGAGFHLGIVPGRFGKTSEALKIAPGKSFKLRAGSKIWSFKTVGKSKVTRSKYLMGVVNTDTTTEAQLYQLQPSQIMQLCDVSTELLYRLLGNVPVDGVITGPEFVSRLSDFAQRFRLDEKAIFARLCKTSPAPPSSHEVRSESSSHSVGLSNRESFASAESSPESFSTRLFKVAAEEAVKNWVARLTKSKDSGRAANAANSFTTEQPSEVAESVTADEKDDVSETEAPSLLEWDVDLTRAEAEPVTESTSLTTEQEDDEELEPSDILEDETITAEESFFAEFDLATEALVDESETPLLEESLDDSHVESLDDSFVEIDEEDDVTLEETSEDPTCEPE